MVGMTCLKNKLTFALHRYHWIAPDGEGVGPSLCSFTKAQNLRQQVQ